MKRWGIALALVAAGLAACNTPPRQPTYTELEERARRGLDEQINRPEPDTCQREAHQSLVGTLGSEINQSNLPAGTRVICHQCAVTMDYRSDRLNIELGANGRVTRVRCG